MNADIYRGDKELLKPEAILMYTFEFVSVILFFAGLIIIYNLRSIIESDNKQSYRYMAVGLSVLSLSSLASVIVQQTISAQFMLQHNSIFIQVMYWIGMITGFTLLMSGVSSWLPVYRKKLKYNRLEINKLELFKKIEQLIRFENRNNVILFQAIELMLKQYSFNEVGCFLYSQKNKKMTFLGAADNKDNSSFNSQKIQFDNESILKSLQEKNLELVYNSTAQKHSPDLLLPMVIDDKLLGLFCFYSDDEIEKQSVSNLQLILEILSTKLIEDAAAIKNDSMLCQMKWQQKVNESIGSTKTVKESILLCKTLLQDMLAVEFLTITFPLQGKFCKHTVAENNLVLENLNYEFSNKYELEQYVLQNNIPVIIDNLDIETDFIVDIHALKSDMKSIIAFPISQENGQVGVVVGASKQYDAFTNVSLQYFKSMHPLFERLILNSIRYRQDKSDYTRRASLKKLLQSFVSKTSSQVVYKKISDHLTTELQAKIVRISLFDSDNRFLNSQVMSTSANDTFVTPDDATMMLDLMPNHRKVLMTRETVHADTHNSEVTELQLELRQIYGDKLTNITIVPFYFESKIVGVITVGKSDESSVMTAGEIRYVEDIASMLTIHSHINQQSAQLQSLKKHLQQNRNLDKSRLDPLHNLKSSLTGIIGSVELLKDADAHDTKFNKYISMLDKSAKRMSQIFQNESVGK